MIILEKKSVLYNYLMYKISYFKISLLFKIKLIMRKEGNDY